MLKYLHGRVLCFRCIATQKLAMLFGMEFDSLKSFFSHSSLVYALDVLFLPRAK